MNHIDPDLHHLLRQSDADRITFIRTRPNLGYTRAKEVLGMLNDLLQHPPTHRMPNLLIVGETNNGKTVIANRFIKDNQTYLVPGEDFIRAPVMLIQAPPVPDERRFYNSILEELFTPYKLNDKVDRKQQQVIRLLESIRLRMLLIDEIHNVLAGSSVKQRAFLNVIKYLANELQIPIVALGTKDAFRAIQSDPQLANRFEPAVLPAWTMNEEYQRLLISFESLLPLQKPSELTRPELAVKILALTEGTIGEISELLRRAAIEAIKSGDERITQQTFNRINWLSPTDRRRQIDRVR